MHKVFISYHHTNDQYYKEELLRLNNSYKFHIENINYGKPIFVDNSVDTGEILEHLSDEVIREKIRDDYLRDSTVTILLVGTETKYRKHIDWELYSSMYNGKINKQSGILIVNLPTIANNFSIRAGHGEHKIYPEITYWTSFKTRKEYEDCYPYMPERIIDNLLNSNVKISVTNWDKITDPQILKYLIDLAFKNRFSFSYDLNRLMRRQNFNPKTNFSSLFNPYINNKSN